MRQSTKGMWIAASLALLAGCATVQVSGPTGGTPPAAAASASTHGRFGGARPAAERDGYRPPRKLAVLLPMTGQLATAASPVRDGLLAAYYAERRDRPELAFYDTLGTPAGAVAAVLIVAGFNPWLACLLRAGLCCLTLHSTRW